MTLAPATRLGPYEIVAPLGAGGMGEVYRARDSRLGRDVAIKVLPAEVATDPERLRRFEQEAKAVSALNHPNILTLFDVGRDGATSYLVTELLEGESLRELLRRGPLPPKRAVGITSQIAKGLAAAHAKGIVHRDLKPENLFLTADGGVKILDFGLAKLELPAAGGMAEATTVPGLTATGMVMGTAGYMAPEQVRGEAADARSDLFALGCVLFELLFGQPPFLRGSMAETLSAILRDGPPGLDDGPQTLPAALAAVLRACLEKTPQRRLQSARDLELMLALCADGRSPESGAAATSVIEFRRLTFRRGTIESARFVSGDSAVVYGATWGGRPVEPFLVLAGDNESRSLGFPGAEILAASQRGQLALSLRRERLSTLECAGTLATVSIGGGAPHELAAGVSLADWEPGGQELALVHRERGIERLEYPPGRLLYETAGRISSPRISPDGERVACFDHPTQIYSSGSVVLVDRSGKRATLSTGWLRAQGLAWSPDGREIWFTASRSGYARSLHAVSFEGRERLLLRAPGSLTLHDVSSSGRLLLGQDLVRREMRGSLSGAMLEIDLSWHDYSAPKGISADGERLLFHETGDGGGTRYSVYLWTAGAPVPTRIGEGRALALSPDSRSALVLDETGDRLVVLPTGLGSARSFVCGALHQHGFASFTPDAGGVVFAAQETGAATRCYLLELASGNSREVTPAGTTLFMGESPVEPSGRRLATASPEGLLTYYSLTGNGAPEPLVGALPGERVIAWDPREPYAWVRLPTELPARIHRLDLASGARELQLELVPGDSAGVAAIDIVCMSPSARAYVYSYVRTLSDLYLVDGVR